MRTLAIFAFAFAISLMVMASASAEPDVTSVQVSPSQVDNQVDEEVNFEGECSICDNEENFAYFYWNSSIDSVLKEGVNPSEIYFMKMSSEFTKGDHEITLVVRDNNGDWSSIDSQSTTNLQVDGKDSGGDIQVNFQIDPPLVSLGETATFRACKEMLPDPQPCVSDPNANLQFDWDIMKENTDEWIDLGNEEAFQSSDFVVGNHTIRLIITDSGDDSDPGTQQFIVNPPVPIAVIVGGPDFVIKEGQTLNVTSNCFDRFMVEITCDYLWELRKADGNELVSTFDKRDISLTGLTHETQSYRLTLKTTDENGTVSNPVQAMVMINPPNVAPVSMITVSPDPVGSKMASEYYKNMNITFDALDSTDSDGQISRYHWFIQENNEWVEKSPDSVFTTSFDTLGYQFVRLIVVDNDEAESSATSVSIKIIDNEPPVVKLLLSSSNGTYSLNSNVSDTAGGSIVSFEWSINGVVISDKQNTTWIPNASGDFVIKLKVVDNGGAVAEATETITFSSKEPKNFVALFSSKVIEVGESVTINFSATSGQVKFYKIKVTNVDDQSDIVEYSTSDNIYSVKFDAAGTYTMDVEVIWADGIPQGGLSDWFGPTIVVGGGGANPDAGSDEEGALPTDDIPSASLVLSLLIISLVAVVSRRQR